MSKTKTAPKMAAEAPGITLAGWLGRQARWIALAAIAIAAMRIVATYSELSPVYDEPGHMACGMQYLAQHVYAYESQHPPLARVASAMGPFLAGSRPLGGPQQDLEGVAILYQSGDPGGRLALMRWGILPFFLLASAMVYLWAKRHFGAATGGLAAVLFTLVPTVLAHGGVATTDMPLTGCLAAAYFAMLVWVEQPDPKHSVLFGLATALAVCCKFTALGFFPAAALFSLAAYLAVERPSGEALAAAAKARAMPLGIAVLTGAVVIWAIYGLAFGEVSGWGVKLPAPVFFDGVRSALHHNQTGHAAYLLGRISNDGWWYFFPVLLAVKSPLGWLLLAIGGVAACVARRGRTVYLLPLAFAAGVLLPAMASHVNIGLRHILPIFVPLAIVAAIGLMSLIERALWGAAAGALLVGWIAVSGAGAHPDYLAYFNEFAGDQPERIAIDSDLDWGQNDIRLARRLRAIGATEVAFSEFSFTPQQLMQWPGLPRMQPINPLVPADGWNVVSPTRWMLRRYGIRDNRTPWFPYLKPVEKVGALRMYYVAPGSVRRQ